MTEPTFTREELLKMEASFRRGHPIASSTNGLTADMLAFAARNLERVTSALDDYRDELSKQACDECSDCGALVMCRFHSLLSALQGEVWPTSAIERANLHAERDALRRQVDGIRAWLHTHEYQVSAAVLAELDRLAAAP